MATLLGRGCQRLCTHLQRSNAPLRIANRAAPSRARTSSSRFVTMASATDAPSYYYILQYTYVPGLLM